MSEKTNHTENETQEMEYIHKQIQKYANEVIDATSIIDKKIRDISKSEESLRNLGFFTRVKLEMITEGVMANKNRVSSNNPDIQTYLNRYFSALEKEISNCRNKVIMVLRENKIEMRV